MTSAETIENVKNVPMGTVPSNERQARPLARLEPEQQKEAWRCQEAQERLSRPDTTPCMSERNLLKIRPGNGIKETLKIQ